MTQPFTLPADSARPETPSQRNRRWWLGRVWTLTWAGTVLLTALLGLGWIDRAMFCDLVQLLWAIFGGVEGLRGLGAAADRALTAYNRKG